MALNMIRDGPSRDAEVSGLSGTAIADASHAELGAVRVV
jgi:hypothetical protein